MYKYQLLYVYINEEQSGGFMWYAVFSRSMVALMWGLVTLLSYLFIREVTTAADSTQSVVFGPFYGLLPLPIMVLFFWYKCESKFKAPTKVHIIYFTLWLA